MTTTYNLGEIGAIASFTPNADGTFNLNDGWCITDNNDACSVLATQLTMAVVGVNPERMGTFIGRFDSNEPYDDDEPLELYVTVMPEGETAVTPSFSTQMLRLI